MLFNPHSNQSGRCNYVLRMALLLLLPCLTGCNKYLDKKPLVTQVVPKTLSDLQTLLDNNEVINRRGAGLLEAISDNYYVPYDIWQAQSQDDRLNYIWDKNAQFDNYCWELIYGGPIYYANFVLDNLEKIPPPSGDQQNWNNIKGAALFYRSFAFYELAQLYCKAYTSSVENDPGIVLRTTSLVTTQSVRASIKETYERMIADLKEAGKLLPAISNFPTRPTKGAAWGLLARVYLSMRDYAQAKEYSDLSLKEKDVLIDFNTLLPANNPPIEQFNAETIFYNTGYTPNILGSASGARIDSVLFNSYASNDLRKVLFFSDMGDGSFGFQGSYGSQQDPTGVFDGITTSELFLIRSECNARLGSLEDALTDLNKLLVNRWKNDGSFMPVSVTDKQEALRIILLERRKELIYRGLRWTDIRRLNIEENSITLRRNLDGVTYVLPPNDLRSVLLIPQKIINLSSIQQNPR